MNLILKDWTFLKFWRSACELKLLGISLNDLKFWSNKDNFGF